MKNKEIKVIVFFFIFAILSFIGFKLYSQSQDLVHFNSSIRQRVQLNVSTDLISFESSAIIAVNQYFVSPGDLKVELNGEKMPWKSGGRFSLNKPRINSIKEEHKLIVKRRISENPVQYQTLFSARAIIKPVSITSPKPGYVHRMFDSESKNSRKTGFLVAWTPSPGRFKVRLFKRGAPNPGMVKVWGPLRGNSVMIPESLLEKDRKYHVEIVQESLKTQFAGNLTDNSLFYIAIQYMLLFETD